MWPRMSVELYGAEVIQGGKTNANYSTSTPVTSRYNNNCDNNHEFYNFLESDWSMNPRLQTESDSTQSITIIDCDKLRIILDKLCLTLFLLREPIVCLFISHLSVPVGGFSHSVPSVLRRRPAATGRGSRQCR